MASLLNFSALIAQAGGEAPEGLSPVIKLVIAVAVVFGSFFLGSVIARYLRMRDFSFKIGLLLFTLFASLTVLLVGWPPKRGIDLSGGVVLVYEVDRELSQPNNIQAVVGRLKEQLTADGDEKTEVKALGANQLEVTLGEGVDAARVDRAVQVLRNTSDISLRSEGRRTVDGKSVVDYRVEQQSATVDMDKLIAAVGKRINPSGVKELTIRQYGREQLEVIIPEIEKREVDDIKKRISTSGLLEFRIVANETDDKDLIKVGLKTPGRDVYIGGNLAGRWVKAGPDLDTNQATTRDVPGRGKEILVRIDRFNVDGRYLTRASQETGQRGDFVVGFSFNAEGAEKFGQLTSRNLPDPATDFHRRLGIILDNEMLSAPRINSTIHDRGVIEGVKPDEIEQLVSILNAGSLPATLRPEPISQQRVSSQLGDDTIKRGTDSMIISTGAILVFMLIYYRFAGMVADIAVMLNMIVTVAIMILIKAAFTLPGLAGLVLTVGMAVDANVLIYERIREETERGASLRMAIRNGFGRAMATIIDSHVTTLISGVVLYIVGTDQIKGFAVTLVIGLLMSLFTAVYVARVLFDIAEKQRWITRLKMMHVIGHTDIDFIRWRTPAITVSVVIIAIGLVATAVRGKELLDIDFTGGSSVQLEFAPDKPHDIAKVREAVDKYPEAFPDVAVSSVGEQNLNFKVDTSQRDIKEVETALQKAFVGSLQTYGMSYRKLETIEAPPAEEKSASAPAPEKPAAESKAEPGNKAEEKPAVEAKPEAESKPAEETKGAEEKNSSDEKSKSSQVTDNVNYQVASASDDAAFGPLLLAQAESAKPADKAPVEPQPSDKPADAKESAPTEKPSEAEKPAEKPAAASTKPAEPAEEATAPVSRADMAGGTRVELDFDQEISYSPLREMIDREMKELGYKEDRFELSNPKYQFGSDMPFTTWTLETTLKADQTEGLLQKIQRQLAETPVFPSSNQIGGKVAGDTQLMALYAILASMAMIVIYIWIRFENVIFGLAAVLALVHDVLVTTGFLAISFFLSPYLGFLLIDPFKISLAVMAALLTIVGFSINDTIVVFDRIREVRGKSPNLTEEMINLSVNQTLSRTLLTSGTVLIASVILYFVGGPGIHAFAYSMVVGVVAGTYSSVYIAAPVLLWMKKPASRALKGETVSAGSGNRAG